MDSDEREAVRAGLGVGAGAATVSVTKDAPPFSTAPHDRQKRLDSGTSFAQVRQVTTIPYAQRSVVVVFDRFCIGDRFVARDFGVGLAG